MRYQHFPLILHNIRYHQLLQLHTNLTLTICRKIKNKSIPIVGYRNPRKAKSLPIESKYCRMSEGMN